MALIKPEAKGYTFYGPQPRFPDFPYSEGKARIDKARELMQKNHIDLLLLWKEEDCRYYTGYNSTHWMWSSIQPMVALIP
ncbi:MAG: aminopeptidase P family N-terminal domain-containing protein, partial [Candidatus Bathyarchaeia archaeon]